LHFADMMGFARAQPILYALVVTRVRSTTTKCTRGRGCNGHPAFPTPSLGESFINGSGALRGEGVNAHLDSSSLRAERSNPFFLYAARWIASRSLSSGAHSRDPLARNDGSTTDCRGCLKIESALLLEMQPVAMSRPREGTVYTQWSTLRALPKPAAFRVRPKA
jgi:hypothetical protein